MQSGDFFKLFKAGFILFLFLIKGSVADACHNIPFVGLPFSHNYKLLAGLSSGLFLFHLCSAHSDYSSVDFPPSIFLPCLLLKLVSIHCGTPVMQAVPPGSCHPSNVTALWLHRLPLFLFCCTLVCGRELQMIPVTLISCSEGCPFLRHLCVCSLQLPHTSRLWSPHPTNLV